MKGDNYEEIYYIIFSGCIILVSILSLNNYINREPYKLHGTFSIENGVNWISFNKENNLYAYYNSGPDGQIEYKGYFEYNKLDEYRIKDGFFENYTVEVHNKYIILKNDSTSEKFIKTSDIPGYILKE